MKKWFIAKSGDVIWDLVRLQAFKPYNNKVRIYF